MVKYTSLMNFYINDKSLSLFFSRSFSLTLSLSLCPLLILPINRIIEQTIYASQCTSSNLYWRQFQFYLPLFPSFICAPQTDCRLVTARLKRKKWATSTAVSTQMEQTEQHTIVYSLIFQRIHSLCLSRGQKSFNYYDLVLCNGF